MGDIRTSQFGSTPFGTSSTRPANPQIGQTYFNGTLGVQEIYTSSGWLPATGANDFNVTLNGPVTTATFTKEYFAGAYTIASALLDNTYDIYVYDTVGNQVGYTKSPSLNATGNFNKIVVIGGSQGDLLSFSYKTTFTATSTTAQVTAGAFITSATPTALPTLNNTTTIVGGNFSSNVAVYFVGSDNIERSAKSIVRSSDSQLIVTRPDNFPTDLGTYKLVVENPGVTRPTGSSLHILNNAISAGTSPNWTTSQTLTPYVLNVAYSAAISASDVEGSSIAYSLISGSLPTGMSLSNNVISGTSSIAGSYTFTIRATDTGGNYVDRQFSLYYDIYNAARLYAPLNNSTVYSYGSPSGTVTIENGASYGNDTVLNKNVLIGSNASGSKQMRVKVPTTFSLGSNHTVSIWTRNNDSNDDAGMLISKFFSSNDSLSDGGPLNIYDGGFDGSVRRIYANTGDGYQTPFTNSESYGGGNAGLQTQTWRNFVFVNNGSTFSLYVNGVFVGNSSAHKSWSGSFGSWTIGGWASSYYGDYTLENHRFSRFTVWDSVLSPSDISLVYQVGA